MFRSVARSSSVLGLAIVLAGVGATPAGAAEDPLVGLEVSNKGVGWGGIRLGMSYVQAERRAGTTLPIAERPGAGCGSFVSALEVDGLDLQLGFSGSKPGDKIETLFVQFEGYQVAATAAELAASLRHRAPGVQYRPDPDAPSTSEADDPTPVFALEAGKASYAIQIRPRDGLLIARRDCLR